MCLVQGKGLGVVFTKGAMVKSDGVALIVKEKTRQQTASGRKK